MGKHRKTVPYLEEFSKHQSQQLATHTALLQQLAYSVYI